MVREQNLLEEGVGKSYMQKNTLQKVKQYPESII